MRTPCDKDKAPKRKESEESDGSDCFLFLPHIHGISPLGITHLIKDDFGHHAPEILVVVAQVVQIGGV
jgi:hypothetical protein